MKNYLTDHAWSQLQSQSQQDPPQDTQKAADAPDGPDASPDPFGLFVFASGLPLILLSLFLPLVPLVLLMYVGCGCVFLGGMMWLLSLQAETPGEWEVEIDERAIRETFPAMRGEEGQA